MTQSQTSTFMSSSFPYGGTTNGLSIHEREREAARIERERQLQNAEPVSLSVPLFPQGPKKVQTSSGDILQHKIHATLGDFKALAPSMSHQKQYSLLGITNKVPQTPIDAGSNKMFNFENNSTIKKENTPDKNLLKPHKGKPQNRTKDEKPRIDLKTAGNKKTVNREEHVKSSKTTSKKSSDIEHHSKESTPVKKVVHETKVPIVKKESSTCEVSKQDQQVAHSGIDEKITSVKKESKDVTTKHKPPKLSIKARTPEHTATATEPNVKKILEEMTQPGPPPLTAIQTPRKNNAPFAFPYNAVPSSLSHCSPVTNGGIKKEKEEQILKDLHISEDENSDDEANDSSDDSDSSSDSDSDSSSDNSPPNSPVRSKLNKPAKSCKLNYTDKEVTKKSQLSSVTLASTTSSLADTGEGGVRGDLAAPAAHTSPLNNTSLNTDHSTNNLSFFSDFGLELPDISKTIMDELRSHDGESNGFDPTLLTNDIALCDKDPLHHFKPIEKHFPEDKTIENHFSEDKPIENLFPEDKLIENHFSEDKPIEKHFPEDKSIEKHFPEDNPIEKHFPEDNPIEKHFPEDKQIETHFPGVTHKEPKVNLSPKKVEVKKEVVEIEPKTSKQSRDKHEKSSKSMTKKKVSDTVSTKSSSTNNDSKDDSKTKKVEKSSEKKGVKSKKTSSNKPTKPAISDGENEEIDVVTVSNDKPLLNKSNRSENKNIKTEESSKVTSKTKSAAKHVNGHKETPVNGHRTTALNGDKATLLNDQKETIDGKTLTPLSPKNGLSEEITLDCNSKPDALVVKIPLALLKRIPLLKMQDSVTINTRIEKSNDVESSPPRKAAKHHLSVECSDIKKPKYELAVNGESKEGRRHSTSSTYNDDNRRKRSPSRESDRYHSKRRRHDSETSRREEESDKKMNGWDRIKDARSPQEHSEVCFCGGKQAIEKKDALISKLYDPEPRVPHGPDYYLHEAKRVKHRADAIKDYTSKAYKYFESVLNFVNCGKALEQNNDSESRSAYQMYLETIDMLKYAMRLSASRTSQEKRGDKRFIGLCLRLQSLLYMRLFKLRKDSMLKVSKSLTDHFKQPKNSQAPSPYNASNPKTTGTPSPMSPTPSPSGSIGSVGSVGSAGSNEAMTTPSRTGNKPSNCMTSPVNTSIPQKIHTMTLQHLGYTNHMLYAYDVWEQSQMIFNDHREFFMGLDRNYGPITLHSSIVDVVEYVRQGYQRLQDST